MAKTVVGLFNTTTEAKQVVHDLMNRGFDPNKVSIVANDRGDDSDQTYDNPDTGSTTGSSAVRGAETGAVLGGLAGLLVGLGALAIPGIGPVIAAGPLASAIAGVGIGAVAGGLIGALVHQGVPEHEAHYYAEGVRRGGTLVTVNASDDTADSAVEIFHMHGAADIDERAARYRDDGYTGYTEHAQPYTDEEILRERARYANDSYDRGGGAVNNEMESGSTVDEDPALNQARTTSYRNQL